MTSLFLDNHSKKYSFSFGDAALSTVTGFSGLPYAKRHWDLSKTCDSKNVLGHRIIATLEALPVIGGLSALIEKIVHFIKGKFSNTTSNPPSKPNTQPLKDRVKPLATKPAVVPPAAPNPVKAPKDDYTTKPSAKYIAAVLGLPLEEVEQQLQAKQAIVPPPAHNPAIPLTRRDPIVPPPAQNPVKIASTAGIVDALTQAMWKNSKKAIEEHRTKDHSPAYASINEGLPSLNQIVNQKPAKPLSVQHFAGEAQGIRPTMEDAHFFNDTDQGILVGVLDGHGGSEVAKFASIQIQKRFFDILSANKGNVHKTFEILFDEVHTNVAKNPKWNEMGSTAVVSFIDKKTHTVYTATLADSEANIYRNDKSIPLSCVRDWTSKKDAKRASIIRQEPSIADKWPKAPNPKYLRVGGLNVSRAIGDVHATGTPEKPGLIHKPKITINTLKPGDTLVLACDGLKDYVPESDIVNLLAKSKSNNPAQELVDYAINKKASQDNVTVITLKIK